MASPRLKCISCGLETWSVILREKHRLKVSEEKMMRGKFVPKMSRRMGRFA
jgi:hypothetical protein